MLQKFIQEPCLEHPWGRLKFWEGSCGKGSGESSPENMLMDSYLGVQQVVTCKGQTLKTKKCKWDMLAQCSLPRRALCRTSFEGDGWSLGSQLSWLQTTDLLLEDWGDLVLTTTPCIIDILQARHLLEIAGDSLWNVFPAPWQVMSATHKNTELTSLFLKWGLFCFDGEQTWGGCGLVPDARIMSAIVGQVPEKTEESMNGLRSKSCLANFRRLT